MRKVFETVAGLTRKPATFRIRFRRLRVGLSLRRALHAACDVAAASLASSGAEHSSAKAVLERFRKDSADFLDALHRNLRSATARLVGWLRGGERGLLSCISRRLFFEGSLSLSRLVSPPAAKPDAIHASVLRDGRLQLLLSVANSGGAANKGRGASAVGKDELAATSAALR